MTDLNKVNFMSKERFDNLSYTNDDELYVVETVVPDDSEVVHVFGDESIDGVKTFTSVPLSVTPSASSNNESVATTEWVSNPTLSTNVVHKSGDETIAGVKTFSNAIVINRENNWSYMVIRNSEGGGATFSCHCVDFKPASTENHGGYIDFNYNGTASDNTSRIIESSSGNVEYQGANCLVESNSTTARRIATVGWVNDPTKSTNVVHRSGDETIAGTKIFNKTAGSSNIVIKSSLAEKTTVPSSNDFSLLQYTDKNNLEIGVVYLRDTPTAREMCLKVHAFDGTSQEMIKIGYDTNNNVYTSAPTPTSATDNTNKLATTAHLINVLKAIYPVGSLYMGTQASCPMSSFFGTWELVSSGKALWTGNGTSGSGTTANTNYANAPANTTINAGLPDPDVDVIYRQDSTSSGVYSDKFGTDGWTGSSYSNTGGTDEWMQSSKDKGKTRPLAAIFTNSIYGASTTVQPPAYVVNVWRRTA